MNNKITTFLIAALMLLGFAQQAMAQFSVTNQPIESTASNPVWFFIQNATTGNVMELASASDDAVVYAKMRPIQVNTDGQLWRFERQANGKFKMINKLGAGAIKANNVHNSATTWGTTSTEVFTIQFNSTASTDRYSIINSSGKYLVSGSASNDNLLIFDTNANQWKFIKAPTSSTQASPVYYQIASAAPVYLTINSNSPYGIQSSSANTFAQATPGTWADQLWRMEYNSTNQAYKLVSKKFDTGNDFLQYNGTINTNGNVVNVSTGTPTDFIVSPNISSSGYFTIYKKGTLTAQNSNTATADVIYIASATPAQLATKAVNTGSTIDMRFNVQKDIDASLLCTKILSVAKILYAPSVGTTLGTQYPQSAYDALTTAYNTARDAYVNGATTTDFTNAYNALRNAVNNFYVSNIKLSSGAAEYYYTMYTASRDNKAPTAPATAGNLLGTQFTSLPPTKTNVPTNQQWIIIDLGDGTLALKNPSTGTYISSASQVYNTQASPLTTTATAPTSNGWSLVAGATAGTYVIKNDRVKSTNNSNYMQFNQYGAGSLPSSNLGNWGGGTNSESFTLNDNGSNYTFVYLGSNAPAANSPTISPASGIVSAGAVVTISSSTVGANIVYTLDGSDPSNSGTALTAASPVALTITDSKRVRAIATASGLESSTSEVSAIYNVIPKVSTPGVQEYYYVLQTPNRENRVVTDKGVNAILLGESIASPSATNTNEAHRWMLVQLGDGSYSWVNKSTRNYINNASENIGASQPGYKAKAGTLTAGAWNFGFINALNRFRVINGSQQLSQGGSGDTYKILNYGSGTNTTDDGCVYSFTKVDEATAATATPALSVPAGDIAYGSSITFTSTTPNAEFHYTLDGTTPTVLSPVAAGGVITVNNALTTAGTFTLKVVAIANGFFNSAISSATYVVQISSVQDGNWSNAATWASTSVPSTSNRVSVNNNVTLDQNLTATDLTINSGKSLTVAPGKQLTVTTALTNNGTFTLQSDATGTATLLCPSSATVTATANQYLGSHSWYVAPSVASSAQSGLSYNSYNETDNTWTTGSSATMTAGKGYLVNPGAPATIAFTGTLNNGNISVPLTYSGTTNTVKPGFNLVGNPYPSYIKWSSVYSASSATANMPTSTMWYRTKESGAWSFATVNGASGESSPTTVSDTIPPMQAFWVRTQSGGGTLNFTNAMRLHHSSARPNLLKSPSQKQSERMKVRLQVSNGTYRDETLLYTDANALDSYDVYDSQKMMNNDALIPEIYTEQAGEKLAINGMSNMPIDNPLALGIIPGNGSAFTIAAIEASNLPANVRVVLMDKATGSETDLSDGQAHSLVPTSSGSNQYSLVLRSPSITTGMVAKDSGVSVSGNTQGQILVALSGAARGADVLVYNSLGQLQCKRALTSTHTVIAVPSGGVYVVNVTVEGVRSTHKVVLK